MAGGRHCQATHLPLLVLPVRVRPAARAGAQLPAHHPHLPVHPPCLHPPYLRPAGRTRGCYKRFLGFSFFLTLKTLNLKNNTPNPNPKNPASRACQGAPQSRQAGPRGRTGMCASSQASCTARTPFLSRRLRRLRLRRGPKQLVNLHSRGGVAAAGIQLSIAPKSRCKTEKAS